MAYFPILSISFVHDFGERKLGKVLNPRGGWVGGVRCLGHSPKQDFFSHFIGLIKHIVSFANRKNYTESSENEFCANLWSWDPILLSNVMIR